jgi:threonine dehydratase
MKIRTGFVSNSSSSSFIIGIESNKIDEFKNSLSEIEKTVLEKCLSELYEGTRVIGNTEYKIIGTVNDTGSSTFDYSELTSEEVDVFYETFLDKVSESDTSFYICIG